MQAGSVLAGWFMGGKHARKFLVLFAAVYGLLKIISWAVRHPRISIPLFAGSVLAFYFHSLPVFFLVALCGFAAMIYWRLHGVLRISEVDTWKELTQGLPRMFRVYKCWPRVMELLESPSVTVDGQVPEISDIRLSTSGVVADVNTSGIAKHASVLRKQEFNIAAGFEADRVVFKTLRPWLTTVRIDWGAHLRKEYTLHDIPESTQSAVWPYRIPFGITESGAPAEIIANEPILLGGVTGSGKSHTAWSILAGYVRLGIPIQVDVIDWSGTEFGHLKSLVGQGIVKSYTGGPDTKPEEIDRVMKRFLSGMKARLAVMEKTDIRLHVPTPEEPFRLLLVDEGLPIAKSMKDQGMDHPLILIASQGRKANYVPLLNTQAAQKDVLGLFRDLTSTRISLRTNTRFMSEVVLGEGCEGDGAKCSLLDAQHDKGVGYMSDRSGFIGFRSAKVTDEDIRSLALGEMPSIRTLEVEDAEKPQVVYRIYGKDGQLLYIGRTRLDRGTPPGDVEKYSESELAMRAAQNRFKEHLKKQPWASEIDQKRGPEVAGVYSNLIAGEDAEEVAIKSLRPPKNIEHMEDGVNVL